MNYFIKNIQVNELFHLKDFNTPIANKKKNPHLILTGKNGTGKTVLLRAIADVLESAKNNSNIIRVDEIIRDLQETLQHSETNDKRTECKKLIRLWEEKAGRVYKNVKLDFNDTTAVSNSLYKNEFILAFYKSFRKPQIDDPKNPTKPDLHRNLTVTETLTTQFLYFLVDLKIQEALARNEQQNDDANSIHKWFEDFECLLKEIYQDDNLTLTFNYKDYTFKINTNGKSFKFKEMSDGYIAAIDIIADLILKMQDGNSPTRSYKKQGIVLIDEIETHLHLELQRLVMPLLTRIFPNIQFIVTTHSPFVLNSMPNAVAYDLEHREIIDKLEQYSYESLAEGYFGVNTESSYMEMRLGEMKRLMEKEQLTNGDKEQLLALIEDFEQIPEVVSPTVVGEFMCLKVKYSEKIKELRNS